MLDQKNNLTFLVTGVMGSGKTELMKIIKNNNHGRIIIADELVEELYKKNTNIKNFIEKNFKKCIKDGLVNKKELGKEVFLNDNNLNKLNSYIQPILADEIGTKTLENTSKVFVELKVFLDYQEYYKNIFSTKIFVFSEPKLIHKRIEDKFPHLPKKSLLKIIEKNLLQQDEYLAKKNELIQNGWIFINNKTTISDMKKDFESKV